MIRFSFLFFLLLFISNNNTVIAQNKSYTLSGHIQDDSNGESSFGASIYIDELNKGVTTNIDGFYSITMPEGVYHITISYIGYAPVKKEIILKKDLTLNQELTTIAIITKEVEIIGERQDKNITSTDVGVIELNMAEIKKLPSFMGEVDVLKTIQLLPGVKSVGDGNTGFYVRGGGPDQNLILLDGAVIYNAAHLLGFFSVFNGDAIESVKLIKGGMPAEYGGRLASVLDVTTKNGNDKAFHVQGGIGAISSRLTIEGPIVKDTSSFILSIRRTYIDALVRPFGKPGSALRQSGYYFYDVNGKANYIISEKDRLYVSSYYGKDFLLFVDPYSEFKLNMDWGNSTAIVRWNHLFSDKLFVNTTAGYNNYNFSFGAEQTGFEFTLFSSITDWNGGINFGYYPSIRHKIKFGTNYSFHTFTPSSVTARSGDINFDISAIKQLKTHDFSGFVSDDFELTNKIRIHAGLRYSYFVQVGPFDRYIVDSANTGQIVDTISYNRNEIVKGYGGPEPRLSIRYELNKKSSIKGSYTYNLQYIHLASLSSLSLPSDSWMPITEIVEPQKGNQYSLGYFRNFLNNMYESSVEVYYKDLQNQIEYKEGSLPSDDVQNNADNQFTFGTGEAYGLELFLKKKHGKFNGWLGYTISYTTRSFSDLNDGNEFYAKYDRRHDVSVVLSYDLNPQWTFSSLWVYGTGNALTVPVAYYFIDFQFVTEYSDRNTFRMPAYHRLDLSATYTPDRNKQIAAKKRRLIKWYTFRGKDTTTIKYPKKWAKKYESSWNFSIFNAYNRHNPYIVYFASEGTVTDAASYKVKAKQMYLFPILPSITWNFKF